MRKVFLASLIFFNISNLLQAQTPNWSETIAPIMYQNCTKCHHPGGIAASSYIEYSNVVSSIYSIKFQVENKIMPPWPGDPTYRHYADERVLKSSEIKAISDWANNGTPLGDINKAPAKPVYSQDSKIGAYDLKVKIPTYTSAAKTSDIYRCFSIPTNLPSNKFISAIEVVPGNPKIVHHVLVFQDTTATTDNLDKADPLPGYTNFGGTGSVNSILVSPYVPGAEPIRFPTGTGVKMYKNARIILQIHYPSGTQNELDSTYVVIRFTTQPNTREVYIDPLLNHDNIINGPLVIPKDKVKTFNQTMTVPFDATLLSVLPHMHLIGKSTKVYAMRAVGDTIPLVRINNWDFHWQGEYRFQYMQKVSKNTKIQSIVTYDNTLSNPNQPSNPTKTVSLGEATTSEMMLTYFYYMAFKTGDENMLQDSTLLLSGIGHNPTSGKVKIYPNPANDKLFVQTNLHNPELKIIDNLGRVVLLESFNETLSKVNSNDGGTLSIDISSLKPGIYYLEMKSITNGNTYQNRFVKQ